MKIKVSQYILITLLLLLSSIVFGQIDPQISQIGFQRSIYNPAAIGTSEDIIASTIARQQWTGFENAPSTQILNISNYFSRYNVGVALTIINDNMGIENSQNIKLKYAYNVKLNELSSIAFGAGIGIVHRKIHTANLIFEEANDPASYLKESSLRPDFDFGMEYKFKKLTVGLVTIHLTNSVDGSINFKIPRHYYFYSSYLYPASDKIIIQSALSLNNLRNVFLFGVSTIVSYKDILQAGISYRIKDAVVILAKIAITPYIQIGYSYDMNAGPIKSYNSGSHEIMIITRFNKNNSGNLKSPRFFD
ncbi:MAG: type IX secretion system membrane protein PorP/SprF [Bacteroidales bacterium]|nr:type IX secretion system membrane protein PorP/SprF [Bacteroidales bacterium]